jgi:Ca2+-binding EF-hand superfamily protein
LNLFIAIILEGHKETKERNEKMFNNDVKDHFKEVWSHYDQDAKGFIKIEDFPKFMNQLGHPLGWDKIY